MTTLTSSHVHWPHAVRRLFEEQQTIRVDDHIYRTYRSLRWGAAVLGLALPWVLYLGGEAIGGLGLQNSMSAYHHTVVRDLFVGILIAVAALLYVYKGFTVLEDWALNLAAICLTGVAIFPMQLATAGGVTVGSPAHGVFAVLFFLFIAYVCIWRARDTLHLIDDSAPAGASRRRRYAQTYQALGALMILSPLVAVALTFVLAPHSGARAIIFFVEATGVYVFAAYWIVKSMEIRETKAEVLGMQGKLEMRRPPGLTTPMEMSVRRTSPQG